MKKLFVYAAICSLATMMAVSCDKSQNEPQNPQDPTDLVDPQTQEENWVDVSLNAGVVDPAEKSDSGASTKVFSSGNTLKWNSGVTHLAVFGEKSGEISLYDFATESLAASATSASFSGRVLEGSDLKYASYPYGTDRTCTGDVLGLKLNTNHTYDASNSIPHNTPLYGSISGGNVTMKTGCAFLKMNLPGTADIYHHITLEASGCAGNYEIDLSTPATPVFSAGDEDELTVTVKDGKTLYGTRYVPIIPGTYNDITITLGYRDADGHPDFSRNSTQSQTFAAGTVYNVGDFAGPYVQSVITGEGGVEETTLSMAGSAVVWKYAGVTNSNYTFKFFYAAHGTAKGDPGWTEVAASSVTGDGADVSFSATATVAAGEYDFYAQVSDGSITIPGSIEAAVAKVSTPVVWNFADIAAGTGDYTPYTYNATQDGLKRIVDESGNPVFPTFSITSGKTEFYYQVWNESTSTWGTTQHQEKASGVGPTAASGMSGGATSLTVGGDTYELIINKVESTYYTFTANKLCHGKSGFNMRMVCPDGFTIKRVVLSTASSDMCNWGIGTTGSSSNKVAEEAYSGGAADITIPSPVAGQDLYLISGNKSSRLQVLTVYYEH